MPATLSPVSTSPEDAGGDGTSLKKLFANLSEVEGIVRLVRRLIIVSIWLLFLGSTLLTVLGLSGSVSQPIAIRIVFYGLTLFFAIPPVLQLIDFSRKADSPSPPIIDGLTKGITSRILRHRQTRFITMYGRQEVAREVWPLEADNFSVARQMKIRRGRRKRYLIGIAVVVVAATAWELKLHVFSPSRASVLQYSVGKEFSIDTTFAITILDTPRCSGNSCSIDIRFRNISRHEADVGPGEFIGSVDSAGTTLCDPYPPLGCVSDPDSGASYYYIMSLIGYGNYYDLSSATISAPQFLPGQTIHAEFTFQVPPRTQIQELELTGASKEAVVRFLTSGCGGLRASTDGTLGDELRLPRTERCNWAGSYRKAIRLRTYNPLVWVRTCGFVRPWRPQVTPWMQQRLRFRPFRLALAAAQSLLQEARAAR